LTKSSLTDSFIQILLSEFKQELMFEWKVTVDSLIKILDIQDAEICFKGMSTTSRRHRS